MMTVATMGGGAPWLFHLLAIDLGSDLIYICALVSSYVKWKKIIMPIHYCQDQMSQYP